MRFPSRICFAFSVFFCICFAFFAFSSNKRQKMRLMWPGQNRIFTKCKKMQIAQSHVFRILQKCVSPLTFFAFYSHCFYFSRIFWPPLFRFSRVFLIVCCVTECTWLQAFKGNGDNDYHAAMTIWLTGMMVNDFHDVIVV